MRGPAVGAGLVAGLLADISIVAKSPMSAMTVQVFPGAVQSHHRRTGLPIAPAFFRCWLMLHNCSTGPHEVADRLVKRSLRGGSLYQVRVQPRAAPGWLGFRRFARAAVHRICSARCARRCGILVKAVFAALRYPIKRLQDNL